MKSNKEGKAYQSSWLQAQTMKLQNGFYSSTEGNFTWQNHAHFYFNCNDHPSATTKVFLEMTEFANVKGLTTYQKQSAWCLRGAEKASMGEVMMVTPGKSWPIVDLFTIELSQGREKHIVKPILNSNTSKSITVDPWTMQEFMVLIT